MAGPVCLPTRSGRLIHTPACKGQPTLTQARQGQWVASQGTPSSVGWTRHRLDAFRAAYLIPLQPNKTLGLEQSTDKGSDVVGQVRRPYDWPYAPFIRQSMG